MDPVRIFIASDARMEKAELALVHSIKKNTTPPVEITIMRAGDPGFEVAAVGTDEVWGIGREPGHPYSGKGAATEFSNFRWAVPQLAGFEGRAIYQDVDQLDIADMRELFEMPMRKPVLCSMGKTCVMLIDCKAIGRLTWWPTINELRRSGQTMYSLRGQLDKRRMIDKSLPRPWNCPDKYIPGKTRVVHYTNMRTQPWKPWPEVFNYPRHHPSQATEDVFWEYYNEAVAVTP